MTSRYVQPGQVLQHTAAAAIASGDVVQIGKLTGVALANIAIGQTGSVQIEGVFSVPKKSGDAFAQGDFVLFDAVAKNFKIGNGGPGCVAFAPALAAATECLVKFTGVPGEAA
jgi:predicted RecA/RadA family phage recombinase